MIYLANIIIKYKLYQFINVKYLKLFSTKQEYEDFISTNKFASPNTSIIEL